MRAGRPEKPIGGSAPNRMREIRNARELTQRQAAKRAGMTPQTWQRYETGERQVKLYQLPRIAKSLGCRVAELLPAPHAVNAKQASLLDQFDKLPPDEQDRLLRIAQAIKSPAAA